MNFTIQDHKLRLNDAPVHQQAGLIEGGEMHIRRAVVLHFTGGATGASSIQAMRDRGVSAHLVVERDGTVVQCVAFDRVAFHAGKSRWTDPKTGEEYVGCNNFTIGIEIANAGDDAGAQQWAVKHASATCISAKHRNEHHGQMWEAYPDAQIAAVTEICKALVKQYNLDDVTSHDAVAPERKLDVGPLFPMKDVREACGFGSTEPVVHWP